MTWATRASVGRPPSIRRDGAGACTTVPGQLRQAYLGRCTTSTRNWAGITSSRARDQDRHQRGPKVYALYAPEVEYMSKARTPYELWDGPPPPAGPYALRHRPTRETTPCPSIRLESISVRRFAIWWHSMRVAKFCFAGSCDAIR